MEKEIAIKSRHSRTASGAKFSIIKYKGETIKALVSILVLRMEADKLDEVFDFVLAKLGIESVEEIPEEVAVEPVSESTEVPVAEEGGQE